jgi:beta-glucosidase
MRNLLRALWAISLSLCFALQSQIAIYAQTDLNDSDEFFQRAIRTGPERDHTRKIEDLLKKMTLEEKVGQMTQLTVTMIAAGRDQDIKIDPAKLEKAIVKYGVGSILNVSDQALTVDR